MTKEQINRLLSEGKFPEPTSQRELVETHISWVILCDQFAYKIKKPIKYSFLDFSTLELRNHFCERELILNQRLSEEVYLEVLPIWEYSGFFKIGGDKGKVVDYTLKMRKLNPHRRMDVLLSKNKVNSADIENLAQWIANFHKSAKIINDKNVLDVQDGFNDLRLVETFLSKHLDAKSGKRIDNAIAASDRFLNNSKTMLEDRLGSGLFRDVHGDLHTRNIFLLPKPQPFDCIEFNDGYRQIDVLSEIAFLCMDLDALGKKKFSELLIRDYNMTFPAMRNETEHQLFRYYKSYRANVRAKVNILRAQSASDEHTREKTLTESKKYLELMESYLDTLPIDGIKSK